MNTKDQQPLVNLQKVFNKPVKKFHCELTDEHLSETLSHLDKKDIMAEAILFMENQ